MPIIGRGTTYHACKLTLLTKQVSVNTQKHFQKMKAMSLFFALALSCKYSLRLTTICDQMSLAADRTGYTRSIQYPVKEDCLWMSS